MRSPAARIIVGAIAWIALAAAGFFLVDLERQAADAHVAMRAFDLKVREATDMLGELRAAQQAYVAAGQGVAFWMPKVGGILDTLTGAIDGLRPTASSAAARSAIDEAAATLSEFATADKRARDYLKSGEQLMAGDVIFTEGGQAASTAARQLEAARVAERQALDAADGARRWLEATVAAAAATVGALAVLLLVPVRRARIETVEPTAAGPVETAAPQPAREQPKPEPPTRVAAGGVPALRAAAGLCTEFGRVNGIVELNVLLGRAADVMDARGLIVWVGDLSGGALHAVLAHGYPPQVLSRMPTVLRSDRNAAAAAYRTGQMQIVAARPGAPGAVVAPLLTPGGCIGALTAEIRSGGEVSASAQALAIIFAAQLTSVLAVAPARQEAPPKAAAGG